MQGTCPSHKGESLLQLDRAVDRLRLEKRTGDILEETDRTPVPCKEGEVVKFAPATEPDNCMLPVENLDNNWRKNWERAWQFTPCSTEKSPEKEDILFIANKDCEWELKSKPGKCAGWGQRSVHTWDSGSEMCDKLKLMNQTLINSAGETNTGLTLVFGELVRPSSFDASVPSWIWDTRCLGGSRGDKYVGSSEWCAQVDNILEGRVYWKVYKVLEEEKTCKNGRIPFKSGKGGGKAKLSLGDCHAYCASKDGCNFFAYFKTGHCVAYKTCSKLKKAPATTYTMR